MLYGGPIPNNPGPAAAQNRPQAARPGSGQADGSPYLGSGVSRATGIESALSACGLQRSRPTGTPHSAHDRSRDEQQVRHSRFAGGPDESQGARAVDALVTVVDPLAIPPMGQLTNPLATAPAQVGRDRQLDACVLLVCCAILRLQERRVAT